MNSQTKFIMGTGRFLLQNAINSRSVAFKPMMGLRSMSSISERFAEAQTKLKTVKDQGNDVKLKLYGLFKQSTVGQNNTKKPGMMDLVGKAKWEAWNSVGSITQEEAQKQYVELVDSLVSEAAAESTPKTSGGPGFVVEVKDGVRSIRFDRPLKRNALTLEMYVGIGNALTEANTDNSTRIVVLTGTGDFYCSGNDLGNFTNVTDIPKMAKEAQARLETYVSTYIDCQKPVIALVQGPAVGIAVTVLGLVDVVYASDRAWFRTPFSSLGQSPEGCSSYTFPRIMGYAKASELLYFNSTITAAQAAACGLVTEVFPDSSFKEETAKRVKAYAELPVKSLVYSKELVRGIERKKLHEINTAESLRLLERWQSEDCMNAIMKFFSKNK